MTRKNDTEFDVILWGATGYTGRLVAEHLARTQGAHGARWALAGRDRARLEKVRDGLGSLDPACRDLPVLLADARDAASLEALVARTKVVCTTVGPYARYGSALVAACAKAGVGYCDLTGEVHWMRRMVDAWHERARETGARIVHACGFDSIPSDLGVFLLQEHAKATHGAACPRVKFYVSEMSGGFSGGTVASMINMFEELERDKSLARDLADPYVLDPALRGTRRGPRDQMGLGYDGDLKQWTGPFIMAAVNTRVVRRSNALLGYPWGKDFEYSEASSFGGGPKGLALAAGVTGALGAFGLALMVPPLRRVLERRVLPAPGEGPSEAARARGRFTVKLYGEANGHRFEARVGARKDPGYGATAVMLGESALCLALDDQPGEGGVLTPASSMGAKLVARLRAAGMTLDAEDAR